MKGNLRAVVECAEEEYEVVWSIRETEDGTPFDSLFLLLFFVDDFCVGLRLLRYLGDGLLVSRGSIGADAVAYGRVSHALLEQATM